MRINFSFAPGRWAIGFIVSEKVPMAGWIDGVEYMSAVENRLISVFIGPVGVNIWIGPKPQEAKPTDWTKIGIKFGEDDRPLRFEP